jgi:hypothetical protein
MAKEPINMKEIMRSMYFDNNFLQKIECSNEQNKEYLNILKNGGSLPEGTFRYKFEDGSESNRFYTVYDAGLTDAEKLEYINLKQLEALKSIKWCIISFAILTLLLLYLGFS